MWKEKQEKFNIKALTLKSLIVFSNRVTFHTIRFFFIAFFFFSSLVFCFCLIIWVECVVSFPEVGQVWRDVLDK